MTYEEDYKRRREAARLRAEEVKKRLNISISVYITDWEEKLKGNDVSYPIETVEPEELRRRLTKIEEMAMSEYAAGIGAKIKPIKKRNLEGWINIIYDKEKAAF